MNKEKLIDKVIAVLGYEHKGTIWFCQLIEDYPNATYEQLDRVADALLDLIEYANSLE